MQSFHLKQKPLAVAVRMLLAFSSATLVYMPQSVQADTGSQAESRHTYDIPAGSLTGVLNNFAQAAGVVLSFDPALTAGKNSSGLQGSYTAKQGFDALLRDTGLQVFPAADGGFTLKAVPVANVSEKADVLPEVAVRASAEKSAVTENSGSYTSNIVTIGKGAQRLKDLPQSISIVTRQQMDDQNLINLTDAMQQVTGVTVINYGSDTSGFSARGFAVDSIQIDGVPTRAGMGMWTSSAFDMATYDRIEVLRGPAGLLQGSGEPGMTINLVRKRAQRDTVVKTNLFAGSWDNYRAEVDVTGALNEDGSVRGRLVAAYQDKKSFIDHVFFRKPILYGTLEFDLAPSTTLSLGATLQESQARPDAGLSLYANGQLASNVSRSTYIGSRWDHKEDASKNYFAELEHKLENGGEAKLRLSAMHRETNLKISAFGNSLINPATGALTNRMWGFKTKDKDYGLDAYIAKPFEALGREHHVLVGANYRYYRQSAFYASAGAMAQNIFNPVYDSPEPDWAYGSDSGSKLEQAGIYAQGRAQLTDNAKLIVGARVSNWKTYSKSSDQENKIDHKVTPYAALIYDLNAQYSAYASYTDIFQAQTAIDVSGEVLKPRVGKQYEAGIKGELYDGRVNLHAAIFRIDDENRAMTDPLNPLFNIAAGKIRSQGLEAEISGQLTSRWNLIAGYAFTDTEYIKAAPGNKGEVFSPDTPRQLLKFWNRYNLAGFGLEKWTVGGGITLNSGIYAPAATGDWRQGGYSLVSAQVAYKINDKWDIALNGNNLFDKKYYSRVSGGGRQNYFGEPRSVMLTLRGSF